MSIRTHRRDSAASAAPSAASGPLPMGTEARRTGPAPWLLAVSLTLALGGGWAPGLGAAGAQEITWVNPAGGSWQTAANWDPQNVPNASGEIALIPDDGNGYLITLGTSIGLDAIRLLNPLGSLSLSGRSLQCLQPEGFTNHGTVLVDLAGSTITGSVANQASGTWDLLDGTNLSLAGTSFENHGLLSLNPLSGPNGTVITVFNSAQITGSGELLMQTDGVASAARIETYYSTFTHGNGHTIRGGGTITANLHNYGTIRADRPGDPLTLYNLERNNYGVLEAVDGGQLVIGSGTTSQDAGGVIRADNAEVVLNSSARVTGGRLETVAGGHIEILGQGAVLTNVTQLGDMRASGPSGADLQTSLTNHGDIYINHAGDEGNTYLRFIGGAVALEGTGTIHLRTAGSRDDACLTDYYTTATQGAGHTIQGGGTIYCNLVNHGTIRAQRAGDPLHLDGSGKTNHAVFEATADGELVINAGAITQSAGGVIRADGAVVTLAANAAVTGGQLESANQGWIRIQGHGARLTSVSSSADIRTPSNSSIDISTSLTNDGDILLNADQGDSDCSLRFIDGHVLLTGTGTLRMQTNGSPHDTRLTTYYTQVTQGEEHTIRGGGVLQIPLTNLGLVCADRPGDPLWLESYEKQNDAIMQALDGGELILGSSAVNQSAGGLILADNGTVGLASSARIAGGQLRSSNGGTFECRGTATLRNVNCDADIVVLEGQLLALEADCRNDGTIVVNPLSGPGNSAVQMRAGNTYLRGSGRVVLCAGDDLQDAAISDYYSVLHHQAGHTIQGTGQISAPVQNQGWILADQPGRLLNVTHSSFHNDGWVAAQDSAIARIANMTQNYGSQVLYRGHWHAHEGSSLYLIGADVHRLDAAVLLDGPGSMIYRDEGATDALLNLAQVDSVGQFRLAGGRSFATLGGLHNEGRVTVGAACSLLVNGAYTQAGCNPAGHAYDGRGWTEVDGLLWPLAGEPLLIEGGTLTGSGHVLADVHSSGRVNPGGSAGRLTIDGAYSQTAEGVLYCELDGRQTGQYDHLQVNGAAELAGTIWIRVLDGFTPVAGDTFQVLSCASRAGVFDVQFGSPGIGLQYEVDYHDTHVTVVLYGDVSGIGDSDSEQQHDPGDAVPGDGFPGDGFPGVTPREFGLTAQVRPAGADLRMALPDAAAVDLCVYDMGGRRIATLAAGQTPAGMHRYHWDGRGADGRPMASGVYFARARVTAQGGLRREACARLLLVR